MSEALLLQNATINTGVFLTQCILPTTRALNKVSFVDRKYVIFVLEGPNM